MDDFRYTTADGREWVGYDLVIMFSPDGGVDRVYFMSRYPDDPAMPSMDQPVLGPIHFMIGRSDRVAINSDNVSALSSTGVAANSLGEGNLLDTTNIWLTIADNRIFTSPNAGIVPEIRTPLNTNISLSQYAKIVRDARQLARTGQTMGGR
jgi:hypothetical protein